MNLFCLILLFAVGLAMMCDDVIRGRISKPLVTIFFCVFIASVISRLGHVFPYSDLRYYSDYYNEGVFKYFSIGYVQLASAFKAITNGSFSSFLAFVAFINLFLVFCSGVIFKMKRRDGRSSDQNPKGVTWAVWRKAPISSVEANSESFSIGALLFLYALYWGLGFSAEVIRIGIATSILFVAYALMIRGKTILAFAALALAYLFQPTSMIAIIVLLVFLYKDSLPANKHMYAIWFLIALVVDMLDLSHYLVGAAMDFFTGFILPLTGSYEHYSVYLDLVPRETAFAYIDRQYIYYRIIAILLLLGDTSDKRYNAVVFNYYLGISAYSLLNSIGVITRITWFFFILMVIAGSILVKDGRYKLDMRIACCAFVGLLELIMVSLWLGVSL